MGARSRIERAMGMSETAWARHTNPWSYWTRIPILPLLALAIYARVWIGAWCLVPIALLCAWTFINPRAFPAPRSFHHYTARGVLGERVWLARKQTPIPSHHSTVAAVLSAVSLVGVLVLAYGLVVLDPWATIAGTVTAVGAKMWFVDRMVWLYDTVGDGRFIPRS
ncbi:MAG: DUF6653 family protein [Pseudomonadota bacterium]